MSASTIAFLFIGIVAVVVVALVLRSNGKAAGKTKAASVPKARTARTRTAEQARSPATSNYKATSITCGENACAAVRAIKDKRFLVKDKDIPPIPVPGCDAKKCTCIYAHHEDRREEDNDRRGPRGLRSDLHSFAMGAERRTKRGRRKSDHE
jgi:hypothetical protein